MTDTLTVPTTFGDVAELAAGLAERVDEERLMLYGPGPVEEGAWVRFAVLLSDQSPALEGIGRAVASIDGGDERPDEARYDIVLDSLQLEGYGDAVYERILMMRQAAETGRGTGQVDMRGLEAVEDEAEAADAHDAGVSPWDAPPASDELESVSAELEAETSSPGWPDARTGEVDADELSGVEEAYGAPPTPPSVSLPVGGLRAVPPGRVLLRPSLPAAWRPSMVPRAEARPASGLFQYSGGGLPAPAHAPRPDLDPSLRVDPAPRPRGESQAAPHAAGEHRYSDEYASDEITANGDDLAAADQHDLAAGHHPSVAEPGALDDDTHLTSLPPDAEHTAHDLDAADDAPRHDD